ncbi:MAG TPA: Rieske 2Fe-2S domain-containing protein [Conexivisphaerales archaeon]|nr:Rieske 2Fe-2S domain-containing protein [Conexivisphaerales archaeon]
MAQPPASPTAPPKEDQKKGRTRRLFLKGTLAMMAIGFLAPAVTLVNYLYRDALPNPLPKTKIANVSQLNVGETTIFFYPTDDAEFRSILFRLGTDSWTAYNYQCTHLGCPLRLLPDEQPLGFIGPCPCHGSMFDIKDGTVHRGPALNPLPVIDLEIHQGSGDIYAVDLVGTPTIHGPGRGSIVKTVQGD